MSDQYTLDLLGRSLGELGPLIEEAVRKLDQPGTRGLRRKLDGKFHFAVSVYGMLRRLDVLECDQAKLDLPHYERVTPVWPGREAHEATRQRDREASVEPVRFHGLQVVVDNTKRGSRRLSLSQTDGGAA